MHENQGIGIKDSGLIEMSKISPIFTIVVISPVSSMGNQ